MPTLTLIGQLPRNSLLLFLLLWKVCFAKQLLPQVYSNLTGLVAKECFPTKLFTETLWVMPDQRWLVALNQPQPLKTGGNRIFGKLSGAINRMYKKKDEGTAGQC